MQLQAWQRQGVEITVKRIVQFRQAPVFKRWIERLYKKRKASKSKVMKTVLKFIMNSSYGKTIEDKSRRKNHTIYYDFDKYLQAAMKPGSDFHDLSDNPFIGLVERPRNSSIELDTPRYIGWAILEMSKAHMWSTHYDMIKRFYGDKATLLYMDTDSLTYLLETTTLDEDKTYMTEHSDEYGGHSFDSTLLGHFKDEAVAKSEELSKEYGRPITARFVEYVGLGPKIYALRYETDCGMSKPIMKAKGIPRHLLQNETLFEQYKQQLETPEAVDMTFSKLEKRNLGVSLVRTSRRGICAVDTKSYHLDGFSVPLGHYKTRGS
jgi:hypothetical protein